MPVPPWPQFVEPVLRLLSEASGPMARKALVSTVVERMNLSPEELAEMAGSTPYTKAVHRAAWALSHASMAGLVESPTRSLWQLTGAGRALLPKYPSGIPDAERKKVMRAGRRERQSAAEDAPAAAAEAVTSEATPEERMRQAHAEIRESLRAELLNNVRAVSPSKFESLVLDVLHKLGYGQDRTHLQKTPAGVDGGIDGVISLDRLGLEKVYLQAKRYAADNKVSRPAIQGFLGALSERRASKGVFITTSSFSKEARECAARASDSLVLIDGDELAELMMDYGVGVSVRETFTLVRTDSDYFEDE